MLGFVGLGQMGAAMAAHLVDGPPGVVVFDVDPATGSALAERGATVVRSAAEVAEAAEIVSVMVRDDDQVRAVLAGPDGLLAAARPGAVVAVHSTVAAGTPAVLAALAADHGVEVVDAPVSGGVAGATSGELAVLVGGSADAFARVEAPFRRWASLVVHAGDVGAGTRLKLARNLVAFAGYVAMGEGLRLAEAAGVDLGQLGEVVRHSDRVTGGVGMIALRSSSGPLAADDWLRPPMEHARALGEKDLDLALALATELGVELPVAETARRLLGEALGVPDEGGYPG
jgi:3-hydroxyisobutyrate dehydrogenase-like beta-hydroxyacid dehydrogenase